MARQITTLRKKAWAPNPATKPPLAFESYAAFHRHAWGASITDARDALGVTLLHSSQPPGHWISAPTPDLVIGRCIGGRGYGLADIGAGRFHTTGRRGESMVMPPNVATSFEIGDHHAVMILGLPYARLRALDPSLKLPADGDFGALHAGSFEDPLVTGLLDRIWQESAQASTVGFLFLEGALLTLATLLLRLSDGPPSRPVTGGLAPWQLRRSIERLRDDLAETVSLAELATHANLSPFHFARAFRQSTGLPPHRYQMALRIERARELLETTDLSVTEIALATGYESSQALARRFAREVGESPSAYRRARQAS